MKQFKIIVRLAVVFVVGAAAGWFAGRSRVGDNVDDIEAQNASAQSRRDASMRSSADAAVQERILRERLATLEKQLAAAKEAGGEKSSEELVIQREEALKKLEAEGKTVTVGELRRLAPDWFEQKYKRLRSDCDSICRRAAKTLEILSAIDVSGRTDEERKVHAMYMEGLAKASQVVDAEWDAITDDMPWNEFRKIYWSATQQLYQELNKNFDDKSIADREGAMLENLFSQIPEIREREYRLTHDEVQHFFSFARCYLSGRGAEW